MSELHPGSSVYVVTESYVSVDDGEIAAFEPIELPSPEQLAAVLRALAEGDSDDR